MNLGGLTDTLLEGDYGRRERSGLIARQHETNSERHISTVIGSWLAHHQRQLEISPWLPRLKSNNARPALTIEYHARARAAPS